MELGASLGGFQGYIVYRPWYRLTPHGMLGLGFTYRYLAELSAIPIHNEPAPTASRKISKSRRVILLR